VVGSGRGLI